MAWFEQQGARCMRTLASALVIGAALNCDYASARAETQEEWIALGQRVEFGEEGPLLERVEESGSIARLGRAELASAGFALDGERRREPCAAARAL